MTDAFYGRSGVNYGAMDPVKVNAQHIGLATAHNLLRFGFREISWSRGESVYLIEGDDLILGFVVEGLGTKNLVTDVMWHVLGVMFYDKVGRDAVCMILNDMITLGVMPMVVGQYLAAGSDRWFANPAKSGSLAVGWAQTCDEAGACYGCGETPTLRDIIFPTAVDIAGASMGMIKPKDRLINPANITGGDAIVLLGSSGIHANGLTALRDLAELVSYRETMDDGRMFGEAILDPTTLYVPVMEAILDAGIRPHYAVNITGHGWRKIMRAVKPFVYRLNFVPELQAIFRFIQSRTGASLNEMYATLNMGVGFVLIVRQEDVDEVIALAQAYNIPAWRGGGVEKRGDEKKLIIEPLGIEYDGSTLAVR